MLIQASVTEKLHDTFKSPSDKRQQCISKRGTKNKNITVKKSRF